MELTDKELEQVIEDLAEKAHVRSTRVLQKLPNVRYEKPRFFVYFQGVLMAKCTSLLSAEKLKRVLLGKP